MRHVLLSLRIVSSSSRPFADGRRGSAHAGLSGITWGGWNTFFYLFTYADTRDAFDIPHDIKILEEVCVFVSLLPPARQSPRR